LGNSKEKFILLNLKIKKKDFKSIKVISSFIKELLKDYLLFKILYLNGFCIIFLIINDKSVKVDYIEELTSNFD